MDPIHRITVFSLTAGVVADQGDKKIKMYDSSVNAHDVLGNTLTQILNKSFHRSQPTTTLKHFGVVRHKL